MASEQPIWRQALNDEHHPLYRAAWLIFKDNANMDYAATTLESQKLEVIPFIYTILDDETLYADTSLAGGMAPVNATTLLGKWKVTEAAERLWNIAIKEDNEPGTVIYEEVIDTLKQMGSAIRETILSKIVDLSEEQYLTMADLLSEVGKGDERALNWLAERVDDHGSNRDEIEFYVDMLLIADLAWGKAYLEEKIRQKKYSKASIMLIKEAITFYENKNSHPR